LSEYSPALATDKSGTGSVFVLGSLYNSTGPANEDSLIIKYNFEGTAEVSNLNALVGSEWIVAGDTDTAANLYTAVTRSSGEPYVAKLNSSGVIQWQRSFPSTFNGDSQAIAVNNAGDVHYTGTNNSVSPVRNRVVKLSTAGATTWQREYAIASPETLFAISVALDSSSNVYSLGVTTIPNQITGDIVLLKYNSAGTLQWQRRLRSTIKLFSSGFAIDDQSNICLVGIDYGASGKDNLIIVKYDTNGNLLWQRFLGDGGVDLDFFPRGIITDSLSNIYAVSDVRETGQQHKSHIAKYNPEGVLQWQRTFAVLEAGNSMSAIGIRMAPVNAIYVSFSVAAGQNGEEIILASLPDDGSLDGNYRLNGRTMSYSIANFPGGTSAFTQPAAGLTSTTTSITVGTPANATVSNVTLNHYKVVL